MSDFDELTVSITLRTRTEMDTSSAKAGGWAYHHVLPVRTYYLTAALLIKLASHPDAWDTVHSVGRDALQKMAQSSNQRSKIAAYIEQARAAGGATDAGLHPSARACTRPRWGGFRGPDQTQRKNDPAAGVGGYHEQTRPLSFPQSQWQSVQALRTEVHGAFNLTIAPEQSDTVTATKTKKDWWTLGKKLANHIRSATIAAADPRSQRPGFVLEPEFTPSDWRPDQNPNWTMVASEKITQPKQQGPVMRLRLATETDGYRDAATLGQTVPAALPLTVLAAEGGLLYHATL